MQKFYGSFTSLIFASCQLDLLFHANITVVIYDKCGQGADNTDLYAICFF